MKESAPEGGAGSDDSYSGSRSLAGTARAGHLDRGVVRTGSSNADPNQFSATAATGSSRSQSERDLAVPEAGGSRAEGRASGKSGAARSDRRETSGGAVCCGAAGCRRPEPLVSVAVGGKERVLCPECAAHFVRREVR